MAKLPRTVKRNPMVVTPFERFLAPKIDAFRKGQLGNGKTTTAASRAHASYSGVNGTNVNFPGFVAAPYSTLQGVPTDGGYESYATVAGDFNNDGYTDLASIESGGTLSVILNPGNGNPISEGVQVTPTNTVTGSVYMFWLETADVDGDGNLDLIGQDDFSTQLYVWKGKGDGTFAAAVNYPITTSSGAAWGILGSGSFVVGDFNGDGFPDIAAVLFGGFFTTTVTEITYINDGKGNFSASSESDSTLDDSYNAALAGQMAVITDGSKPTGIAILASNNGFNSSANAGIDVLVLPLNNDGSGTFGTIAPPTAPLVGNDAPYFSLPRTRLWATNLTSKSSPSESGKKRAQSATGLPTTDIVFITGDGAVYDAPYSGGSISGAVKMIAGGNKETTNSGRADPLIAGHPHDSAPAPQGTPIPFQNALSVGDANGDGYPDLFVYSSGSIYIYLSAGDGSFNAQPEQLAGGFAAGEQPVPQDFDGSGHLSFVEFDSQILQFAYFQGDGSGTFYGAPGVSGARSDGGYTVDDNIVVQATADLNGDGLLDVIALDWTNANANNGYPDIVYGINNGKGQTNAFTFSNVLSGSAFHSMQGAFVQPLAIPNPAGGFNILISGTGGMLSSIQINKGVASAPVTVYGSGTLQCPLNFADAGDLNGDGIQDIVVAYPGDASCGSGGSAPSAYLVFTGAKDGTYYQTGFTPFGSQLYLPRLIDLNNDGQLDLALADDNGGSSAFGVYVLPGLAGGTFNSGSALQAAPGYVVSDIIAGDYNGDGKQDLTLTSEGVVDSNGNLVTNSWGVVQLAGNGDFTFGTPTTIDAGFFPDWGSYADFNGDGLPDLALAIYGDTTTIEDISNTYVEEPGIVQVLPNLGGGSFGPAIGEYDGFYFDLKALRNQPSYSYSAYTFTGNFGSGGTDLLVSGFYNAGVFLNQGTDALTLTSSASSSQQGQNVTLSVALTQPVANPNAPDGEVAFYNGGALLGSAALDSSGKAAFTISTLPVGTNFLRAVYGGDAHHNSAQATASVTVTALSPDFSLTASNTTLSLQQGQTGVLTLSMAANTTFSGAVSFTCSGAPNEATCTVNPASVQLSSGGASSATVVIATTAHGGKYSASNNAGGMAGKAGGAIAFAGVVIFLLPRRRRLALLAVGIMAVFVSASLTGCGSSGNKGTPTGAATLTVTATAGQVVHTQTINLTITK